MIIQIGSSICAVLMFSIVLEVPRRCLPYAALSGAVGWFFYLLLEDVGNTNLAAAFVSTLVVALLSHILARIIKAPVTVFLVAGIFPAVPGAAIYRSVYYLIGNQSYWANYYLMQTLQIAGAMAMAIFIMDSVFRLVQAYQERREKNFQ